MALRWQGLRFGRELAGTLAGFSRLLLLRAGIHQGLFEALREPRSAHELAERLGLAPDLVAGWLRASHAHGLLRRQADQYAAGPFVRWLLDAPEAAAFHAMIDQAALSHGPRLETLPELMKGAERPRYGSPEEALRLAAAARLFESSAVAALARLPGLRRARRVLEIGCGYGTYLAGFLARFRDAQGLGVERDEAVADAARRVLREAEVWRRAEVRTGDFMTMELPEGSYHLALLHDSLHRYAPGERQALFRRVLDKLCEQGVLAILTPVLGGGAAARALGTTPNVATLDLYLRCHRDAHGLPSPSELAGALRAAGFASVGELSVLPGGAARYVWGRAPA